MIFCYKINTVYLQLFFLHCVSLGYDINSIIKRLCKKPSSLNEFKTIAKCFIFISLYWYFYSSNGSSSVVKFTPRVWTRISDLFTITYGQFCTKVLDASKGILQPTRPGLTLLQNVTLYMNVSLTGVISEFKS